MFHVDRTGESESEGLACGTGLSTRGAAGDAHVSGTAAARSLQTRSVGALPNTRNTSRAPPPAISGARGVVLPEESKAAATAKRRRGPATVGDDSNPVYPPAKRAEP
ncbi:unnamed protein product [Symbiodinium natans]|uniref:Uncharacterized protein n=1 Tax=Symbiodinium natans TaxID=878477 RepID=A0A812MXQ7_9DINO|nr:unnamed protein product [Symbiodinium natans]